MRQWILLLAVLTCCEHALAMGGGYGTKPVNLSDSHVSELANRPGRVGGYWVNSNDWFYFAGDTAAFNSFLQQYAKLNDAIITAIKDYIAEVKSEDFPTPKQGYEMDDSILKQIEDQQ